ncbi:MAG TPA: hypothetical protein HPP77_03635 [Candidatus Hydrogenedentes bacterium]|nr:hypothetical protein [Candidatus Hydrogenedentota bacterium]HIJ74885.1 hypothetical protein [Candidatus Hydrogenedentota bacterium]
MARIDMPESRREAQSTVTGVHRFINRWLAGTWRARAAVGLAWFLVAIAQFPILIVRAAFQVLKKKRG